jgi:(p)ppGpp synthase/HD superfamily hydrolase
MSTLERAITIAAEAHAGQVDKAGAPYILHPLRVMLRLDSLEARIVGVLHDVVEDNGAAWPLERLGSEGFSATILVALEAVTRRNNESYDDFILRAASDPIGRLVKLADLEDNLDERRIRIPSEEDLQRMAKYRRAKALIENRPWPQPSRSTKRSRGRDVTDQLQGAGFQILGAKRPKPASAPPEPPSAPAAEKD